jgi:hypothetical protein
MARIETLSGSKRFLREGRDVLYSPDSDPNNGRWGIHGESFGSYLQDFCKADDNLRDMTNAIIAKPKPIIIDLLAPTGTLRHLCDFFRCGQPIKGLAVGYGNSRTQQEERDDQRYGVDYIQTDLSFRRNWQEIEAWLGNDKADLIVERGFAGLAYLPTEARFQYKAITSIWKMLSPNGGLALLQLPPVIDLEMNDINIKDWVKRVKETNIYCKYLPNYESKNKSKEYGILILRKDDVQDLPEMKDIKPIPHSSERAPIDDLDSVKEALRVVLKIFGDIPPRY